MSHMKCPTCGKQNFYTRRTCYKCATSLVDGSLPEPEPFLIRIGGQEYHYSDFHYFVVAPFSIPLATTPGTFMLGVAYPPLLEGGSFTR